jgi:hypothetical protein
MSKLPPGPKQLPPPHPTGESTPLSSLYYPRLKQALASPKRDFIFFKEHEGLGWSESLHAIRGKLVHRRYIKELGEFRTQGREHMQTKIMTVKEAIAEWPDLKSKIRKAQKETALQNRPWFEKPRDIRRQPPRIDGYPLDTLDKWECEIQQWEEEER